MHERDTGPCVYIVDDDIDLARALSFLIGSRGLATATYPTAESFLTAYSPHMAGCLLTDVRMPGISGLELYDRLRALGSSLPCIVLTGHGDVPMAVEAVKKGVFDFVQKPFDGNALVDKILSAIAVASRDTDADRRRHDIAARLLRLSDREHEVMRLLLAGRQNKIIAADLGIAVRTVEVHRARIFDKMGVKSAVELSNLLAATKLLPPAR